MQFFQHVAARRHHLDQVLTPAHTFHALEESCAPSYVHGNWAAAWVAWRRLFRAAEFYREFAPGPRVLDFGAGTGELFHVLPQVEYSFAEEEDFLARHITREISGSRRVTPEGMQPYAYDCIFALDSLEHNSDPGTILGQLHRALALHGIFIMSGPTENSLYRLGRRLAGFSGHYHQTNIYHLEKLAAERFTRVAFARVPFAVPLFRVSCWRPK